jgi:hypothetical protein
MSKILKRAIACIGLAALCIGAARFCHHQTKGFRITKIQNNLIDAPRVQLRADEIALLRSLFAYPFRYFGRGHQSFAFLSDDDTHVIKIFNNGPRHKIAFFNALSHLPLLGQWAAQQAGIFEDKWKKTFASYAIAYDEMRDKTGLLFLHLNATDNRLPPLTIVDALNIRHRLNPNELGFLIQKKAKLAYPALQELIEAQDIEGAKDALCKLLELFIWKCQRGIHDNDPLIRTNFGFLEQEAVQIDVGPLSKDPAVQDPARMRQEIIRITTSLKHWLEEKCPELTVYLDQQLQERLS